MQLFPDGRTTCFGLVCAAVGGEASGLVRVQVEEGWEAEVQAGDCHLVNERDDTLDDLVKSDYLHEAGCGLGQRHLLVSHMCLMSATTLCTT